MNAVVRAQTALLGDESTVDMDELEQLREAHDCTVPELSTTERSKVLHAAKDYYTSSWSWQLFGLPVLMLYGENEPFIEPHAGFLEAELEDCRTAEIPEGSHNAHVDNPEFIRTKLREFLGEVNADRERAATRQ